MPSLMKTVRCFNCNVSLYVNLYLVGFANYMQTEDLDLVSVSIFSKAQQTICSINCKHYKIKINNVLIPSLATKDELSLIKTLPVRVRISNVCQEHLTGFNLISQSRLTSSKLIGWANWNHQMSSETFNFLRIKTLNFVMRIDNVFICDHSSLVASDGR